MTSGLTFNIVFHNLAFVWFYFLVLLMLYSVAQFIRQRRAGPIVLSAFISGINYVALQIILNTKYYGIILHYEGKIIVVSSLFYMIFSTVAVAIMLSNANKWYDNNISLNSIKEAVDSFPVAICCYYKNGKIILMNELMKKFALTFMGGYVLNGNVFYDRIIAGKFKKGFNVIFEEGQVVVSSPSGNYYRVIKREIRPGKKGVYEIVISRVTELYIKGHELTTNNEKLKITNEKIREYSDHIVDVTRQREIMEAKSNIHDVMNFMLLRSKRSLEGYNEEDKADLLLQWKANTMMLCKEADLYSHSSVEKFINATEDLGIKVNFKNALPVNNREVSDLLYDVGLEMATNAIKHGNAKNLYISFLQHDNKCITTYTDDGNSKKSFSGEGGGLSRLRSKIEKAGGEMSVDCGERFTVTVTLKLKEEEE